MGTKLTYTNRHLSGTYKPTLIDERKKVINRLISICGKYYTVMTSRNEMLEFVGKREFDKWAKNNKYVTDF